MKNKLKKINFKHPKYIFPLLALPFIIYLGYNLQGLLVNEKKVENEITEGFSTDLGKVADSIISKNQAYEEFYKNEETRTLLQEFESDQDSMFTYTDNLTDEQKKILDSLEVQNKKSLEEIEFQKQKNILKGEERKLQEDKEFEQTLELLKLMQGGNNNQEEQQNSQNQNSNDEFHDEDPLKFVKKQMIMMDSLERARNPELQEQFKAEQKLKADREKMEAFLNSTHEVTKSSTNSQFNHISLHKEDNLIKAVIDENIKGYLGSRIRLRLLEDVFVKNYKVPAGTILYAQITGFGLQRVNLNVVSILNKGEIIPINLAIYDLDGMKGLYVPRSEFREMVRQIGSNTNSLQGSTLSQESEKFYTSFLNNLLNSSSQTIANIIKSNKVRLKYNSHILLVNEKEINNNY